MTIITITINNNDVKQQNNLFIVFYSILFTFLIFTTLHFIIKDMLSYLKTCCLWGPPEAALWGRLRRPKNNQISIFSNMKAYL